MGASSEEYLALSSTGVAGPGGGTEGKPVGTVWVGLADRRGGETQTLALRFQLHGERQVVRDRTVKSALQLLRLHVMNVPLESIGWPTGRDRHAAP